MFMTPDIEKRINYTLNSMEERVAVLQTVSGKPTSWSDDGILLNAAERAFHVAVECVTDVGNDLIDSLVMRDAGGYGDIAKVLAEENVVSNAWYQRFLGAVEFRRRLIREYQALTPSEVESAVGKYADLFPAYASFVKQYIGMQRS